MAETDDLVLVPRSLLRIAAEDCRDVHKFGGPGWYRADHTAHDLDALASRPPQPEVSGEELAQHLYVHDFGEPSDVNRRSWEKSSDFIKRMYRERINALLKHLAAARSPSAPTGEGRLRPLVEESARQFRFYEQSHRTKGTPDADAKAEVNRALAEKLEAALAAPSDPPQEVERLRAALKPFADAAENLEGDDPDRMSMWESPAAMALQAEDFRRAAAALQGEA